jgi:hypothetical protein
MAHLTYLLDEICAGVEIYYTGRSGGQYLKTAFVLCDDYTELTSKLFLLTDDPGWSDQKPNKGGDKSHFKTYHDVLDDVQKVFAQKRNPELGQVQSLHGEMKARRGRRNDFFHSTALLDLSVTQRNCVEAFCDLLTYGELLFGRSWADAVCVARNLETCEVLLRLERKSFGDPSVTPKVNRVIQEWPRNVNPTRMSELPKRGMLVTSYPEDVHLKLCVVYGGKELRDKLAALL